MADRSDDPSHHEQTLYHVPSEKKRAKSYELTNIHRAKKGGNLPIIQLPSGLNLNMLHNCCNKGRGIHYPVCRMVHIKDPSLLIKKSSP